MERDIGATSRVEYIITLDMAKELAMVENNEKGRQTRRYFIQIEKEFHKQSYNHQLERENIELKRALNRLLTNSTNIDTLKEQNLKLYDLYTQATRKLNKIRNALQE
jgi:anti-repressor protein